jgi:hypothetical protein
MAKRPRSARLAVTSETRHLIARAISDDEVLTLCGWSGVGIWGGGNRLCKDCQASYFDLTYEVKRLQAAFQ